MIDITPVVTYRNVLLLAGGAKRKAQRAIAEGAKAAVRFWWRSYLPRHFKGGAVQRYKYEPRTRGYLERRRRAKGHSDPLTFTGTMRRMFRASIRIRATLGKGAKGLMRGPKHAFVQKSGKATNQPDKPREVKATTVDELGRMARELQRTAAAHAREIDPATLVRP